MNSERASRPAPTALRVAIAITSTTLASYQAEILQAIRDNELLNLTTKLVVAPPTTKQRRNGAIYSWFERRDNMKFDSRHDPLAPVDATKELSQITTIDLRDGPAHADELAELELDVILDFSGTSADGLAPSSRYGIWSLIAGEGDTDNVPPFAWEVLLSSSLSTATVRVAKDGQLWTIARTDQRTYQQSISRNRRQPYWGGVLLLLQRLEEVAQRGWDVAVARAVPLEPASAQYLVAPTAFQVAPSIVVGAANKLTRRMRGPIARHWKIALRIGAPVPLDVGPPDLTGFSFIEAPRGHFYADPFLVMHDDQCWLFFEDFSYATGLGTIGCAPVLSNATIGPVTTVLERPSHLSFPCVFEHHDQLLMIPEGADNGSIDLYRCEEFPNNWVFDRVLLAIPGVDTTIVYHNDRFWLFTSIGEPHAQAEQLLLFTAETLGGPWIAHPANPLSADVRTNRSGGATFLHGDRIYRVTQSGINTYGYGFAVHEILTMTATEYSDRQLFEVEPTWAPGLSGTHSYARCGNVEAIDALIECKLDSVT